MCSSDLFGYVEVIRELLARGAAVDAANNDGVTPLLAASDDGQLEVVRELLLRGASPGVVSNAGDTARSAALAGGHDEIAKLLRAALALA